MRTRRTLIGLTIVVAATGCGHTPSPHSLLQVAGTYDIQKFVTSDTCGGPVGTPFSNPGTVSHEAGAARFVLNDHGTRNLPGQVNTDGSMALDASSSLVAGTIAAVDSFSGGRFTTTGFDVHITTDLASNPNPGGGPACRVDTTWHAIKQGAPNIIPG